MSNLVTYELFAEGEGTKLVLTHNNLENMLNGSPLFLRAKNLLVAGPILPARLKISWKKSKFTITIKHML
ncbi:hypothetical protein [Mucilaginibacter sp.]|uniref:hypothetical protein n=1 Tax=Mucilaginibacter sp. TaxID=1882438 RepID=UPI0026241DBA|nr:hypothetical protein [Mucilaginibacter sp.]